MLVKDFLLVFTNNYIEVWNFRDAKLVQAVRASNIRVLNRNYNQDPQTMTPQELWATFTHKQSQILCQVQFF